MINGISVQPSTTASMMLEVLDLSRKPLLITVEDDPAIPGHNLGIFVLNSLANFCVEAAATVTVAGS
jgi:hypothetical protein